MFDTDRYAWVRPKSPPSQVQSPPLKNIQNPKSIFRSEPPNIDNPQNPPRTLQTHPYHQTLPIRIHPGPYGCIRISDRAHQAHPKFQGFSYFLSGDSQISCDRTHSSQVLPGGSKRIRIIRRFRYGSILVHSDAYGSQIEPIRHILIFGEFSKIFQILSDQVRDGPQAESFRGGQGIHILIYRYKRDMATWPPPTVRTTDVFFGTGPQK